MEKYLRPEKGSQVYNNIVHPATPVVRLLTVGASHLKTPWGPNTSTLLYVFRDLYVNGSLRSPLANIPSPSTEGLDYLRRDRDCKRYPQKDKAFVDGIC